MAMIFLQVGATVWIIRANQIGGDDPDVGEWGNGEVMECF